PDVIEVPVGDRLVVELVNTDDDVHDLVLDNGARSGRLSAGESAEIDLGVVGRDVEGWCSVAGHRQMGMTLDVVAVGAVGAGDVTADDEVASSGLSHHHGTDRPARAGLDLLAEPGPGFAAHPAELPPAPEADVHELTLTVTEVTAEVAPGVEQERWTFNGTVPGATLRGKVGDVFEITLVNDGTIGHSVDFHAGALAPDEPMRTIPPGESLVYRYTATRSGIWMYHCSTMPMSSHIAAGMTGAVIIDPEEGLAPVDREYLLVQSEVYLSSVADSAEEATEVDPVKIADEEPDLV